MTCHLSDGHSLQYRHMCPFHAARMTLLLPSATSDTSIMLPTHNHRGLGRGAVKLYVINSIYSQKHPFVLANSVSKSRPSASLAIQIFPPTPPVSNRTGKTDLASAKSNRLRVSGQQKSKLSPGTLRKTAPPVVPASTPTSSSVAGRAAVSRVGNNSKSTSTRSMRIAGGELSGKTAVEILHRRGGGMHTIIKASSIDQAETACRIIHQYPNPPAVIAQVTYITPREASLNFKSRSSKFKSSHSPSPSKPTVSSSMTATATATVATRPANQSKPPLSWQRRGAASNQSTCRPIQFSALTTSTSNNNNNNANSSLHNSPPLARQRTSVLAAAADQSLTGASELNFLHPASNRNSSSDSDHDDDGEKNDGTILESTVVVCDNGDELVLHGTVLTTALVPVPGQCTGPEPDNLQLNWSSTLSQVSLSGSAYSSTSTDHQRNIGSTASTDPDPHPEPSANLHQISNRSNEQLPESEATKEEYTMRSPSSGAAPYHTLFHHSAQTLQPDNIDIIDEKPSHPTVVHHFPLDYNSSFNVNLLPSYSLMHRHVQDRRLRDSSLLRPFSGPNNTTQHPATLPHHEAVTISDVGDGYVYLNQYKLSNETLGHGTYSIVKLAYNTEDNTNYAMKILSKKKLMKKHRLTRKSGDPMQEAYREIAILKKLNHPNIIKLTEVLDDPSEDSLYMVFELLERGEVLVVPTDQPLLESTVWSYFRDLILGVEYLHYNGILHRDLKPSNLLLDDNDRLKIADFGLSHMFEGPDVLLSGTVGTPAFHAPEILMSSNPVELPEGTGDATLSKSEPSVGTRRIAASCSGVAMDIWSMGITLFSLLFGDVPFRDQFIVGLYNQIRSFPPIFPHDILISDSLQDLILRLLEKDPKQRITIAEMRNHPWISRTGRQPVWPSAPDNCQVQIHVTDEDIRCSVRSIPHLDTLILIKAMLKRGSFHHPFKSDQWDTRKGSLDSNLPVTTSNTHM